MQNAGHNPSRLDCVAPSLPHHVHRNSGPSPCHNTPSSIRTPVRVRTSGSSCSSWHRRRRRKRDGRSARSPPSPTCQGDWLGVSACTGQAGGTTTVVGTERVGFCWRYDGGLRAGVCTRRCSCSWAWFVGLSHAQLSLLEAVRVGEVLSRHAEISSFSPVLWPSIRGPSFVCKRVIRSLYNSRQVPARFCSSFSLQMFHWLTRCPPPPPLHTHTIIL